MPGTDDKTPEPVPVAPPPYEESPSSTGVTAGEPDDPRSPAPGPQQGGPST